MRKYLLSSVVLFWFGVTAELAALKFLGNIHQWSFVFTPLVLGFVLGIVVLVGIGLFALLD